MQPPVFYAPPDVISDDTIELPADESRHATGVLRLRRGDLVVVVDGEGHAYRAELRSSGKSKRLTAVIRMRVRNFGEPMVNLTLMAGLSTAHKFDTIVQKGTELGVTRFLPILTEKSRVKVDDPRRAKSRTTRLTKVALAAMKQCRRSVLPVVSQPQSLTTALEQVSDEDLNLAFHPGRSAVTLDQVGFGSSIRRVTLLVGPESGFSSAEIEQIKAFGFTTVSLGSRILRAETAGPAVCALVMDRLGELS